MTERLPPPSDLDAEAVVLSALLVKPECLPEIQPIVRAHDFYSDANRLIFGAIETIDAAGRTLDVQAIASELRDRGRLDAVGGTPYLAQLTDYVPAVAHATEHAKKVAEKSYLRRLIALLQTSAAEGYGDVGDAVEWGQSVQNAIFDAARWSRGNLDDDGTLHVVIPRTVEGIAARSRGTGASAADAIKTGITALDKKLGGGLRRGNKYEIAGRPGMGKSALALQVVAQAARQGWAGILVSAEMPQDQIATRLLSQESGVICARLERALLRSADWDLVYGHVERIRKLPMSIVYLPAATSWQVRAAVRREMTRLRRLHGDALELGVVAIDHVHIMNGERRHGENDTAELTRLSKANLWMAGEFNCAVVEVAQLNRGVENRPDKRPNLSDLRGSGSIEEDAHTILFPFRPAYYDKDRKLDAMQDSAPPDECEIGVAKQRGGTTGSVPAAFHGHTLRFLDVVDEYEDLHDIAQAPDFDFPDDDTDRRYP